MKEQVIIGSLVVIIIVAIGTIQGLDPLLTAGFAIFGCLIAELLMNDRGV